MWQLGRLYNNRVMWVCRKAQGTAGGEGGAAHRLEGDHVEAVRVWLEVDQVEGPGQREGGRARAVDVEGGVAGGVARVQVRTPASSPAAATPPHSPSSSPSALQLS